MIARAGFLTALMIVVAIAAAAVKTPPSPLIEAPDLEKITPADFGAWREIEVSSVVLPAEIEIGPGEAVLYRAYRDDAGRIVTLVAAYGPPLGDSVRLHRPESCYTAQGYVLTDRSKAQIAVNGVELSIVRMDTAKSLRREAVSYWLRDGDAFAASAADHQLLSLRRGMSPKSDGALVRVSSPGAGAAAYEIHRDFLIAFVDALSPDARAIYLGIDS